MKKAIIIIFLLAVCVAYRVGAARCRVIRITEPRLFSPIELQEELASRGHNLTVDGRIGPITVNAWQAECDKQYRKKAAAVAMKGWNK